ncbi:hypothetical protein ACEXQB_016015 [Herbiconiux sp. P18]|uniref:hypothetical protein n=1 Tax=Herbiconiux liangxiaofengii TaxID=3342795 RepID=UPI0035B702AB
MTNLAGAYMSRPRPTMGQTALAEREPELDEPGFDLPRISPRIEIVPSRTQRRARPKIAYAAVVVTGVLAIVVTQLLLSIGLSDGAYEISSLQQSQKELDRTNQVLSEQYDSLSSPQHLAASAEALGMVANSTPVYLRLSDGAVLGSPAPASASNPTVSGGQLLIPNSLLAAPAAAAPQSPAAEAPAAAATGDTAGAAPVTDAPADVPWSGALPSPTTR